MLLLLLLFDPTIRAWANAAQLAEMEEETGDDEFVLPFVVADDELFLFKNEEETGIEKSTDLYDPMLQGNEGMMNSALKLEFDEEDEEAESR